MSRILREVISDRAPRELAITGVCDGLSWRAGEIEFAGTGMLSLWVAGLPDDLSISINSVGVYLDGTPLNIEYLSAPASRGTRQINARLPEAIQCGRHAVIVMAGSVESSPVFVTVTPSSNPALESFARNLRDEETGVRHRIQNFYVPLFEEFCRDHRCERRQVRILDCGCGNGLSVDCLVEAGFAAYGIDIWRIRLQQWRQRARGPYSGFCLADATRLPFADTSFDIILSCGVLEHIGVEEKWEPNYRVRPLPNQRNLREQFVSECLRVMRNPGTVYLDHPNGAFPVDFWHHNDYRKLPRWHRPSEKFLPTFVEVRALVEAADPKAQLRIISPAKRFTYEQSRRKWYGNLLRRPAEMFFQSISHRPFDRFIGSPLNPYLVLQLTR